MNVVGRLVPKFGRVCPQSCLQVDKETVAKAEEGVVTVGGCDMESGEGGKRWSHSVRRPPDVVHWKRRVCVCICVCVCIFILLSWALGNNFWLGSPWLMA